MLYVDPVSKTYSEVNAAGIAATYGAADIKIDNFKTSTTLLDDHPVVAGIQHRQVVEAISIEVTRFDADWQPAG